MLVAAAWVSIGIAVLCAAWIVVDEVRRPQAMGIMNLVWPLTALYFSVFAVWAYRRLGQVRTHEAMISHEAMHGGMRSTDGGAIPFGQVVLATSHCGAGCALADLIAEFGIGAAGITLWGSTLWASYAIDLAAAWTLGIVFQYFSIKPMRKLTAGAALVAAIKADTLSIVAFQVGMYGWMAVVYFVLFPGPHLTPFEPVYWLMMQIAMGIGFATAFPMNRVLVKMGWKEAM